ncbi:hypothetical protein ACHHYP_04983 [Achlya hypogyna]|uniref:Uncharacterized protein n=1 Tax=Achlya hypogyna TaxID=1202772 RepID=A0A1V9YZC8_ACHHY|nr:hypothetical protein ACHHYP_04983 [Achlya hypogyna]
MAADYDPYTKQWMREAMVSREVIGELEAANSKLRQELEHKNFKLDLMDACISQIGITDKLKSVMEAKLQPPKGQLNECRISPRKSPRRQDGRSDELIFGGATNRS